MSVLPLFGLTMGDPAGIGPEIVLKALMDPATFQVCRPVIVGNVAVMQAAACGLGLPVEITATDRPAAARFMPGMACVVEAGTDSGREVRQGVISAQAGDLAYQAIVRAIGLALGDEVDGVVTAPIHKEALHAAGHPFPGHTEIFAHHPGSQRVAMMLVEAGLRIVHVSTHVSLRDACDLVTAERVAAVIRLLHDGCGAFGIERPCLGVAGLNPHASDGGLFGREETEQIIPAIEECRAEGILVEGPIPADTMFSKAVGGHFDGCVAMYHDQGHIPFKVAGFSWDRATQRWSDVRGVNVTLGIPIIRTSVDHGTAFDIAGQGLASHTSLLNAIDCAARMAAHRRVGGVA
jgi:4-phospho-D-threonate 3-dehydrogenase / 4-phospho-D-erythronate 3-dehydrogenase